MDTADYSAVSGNVIDYLSGVLINQDGEFSTDERRHIETPPTIDYLRNHFDINDRSTLINFGVGISRIARELIAQTDCFILGVDISALIRTLGHIFCTTPNYLSCSIEGLQAPINNGFRTEYAYSIWAL